MRIPDYLQKIFRRDATTGNYIVEVLLEKYIYAFNEWDSSYFKRRDLDPDLTAFLESSSAEIPLRYGMDLLFTVSQEPDEQRETILRESIRNYYTYGLLQKKRQLRRLYGKALRYVGLSALFLLAATFFEPRLSGVVFTRALTEGLFIGGWVFLWEAISQVSFNRSRNLQQMREYERLANSRVLFTYDVTPLKQAKQDGYPSASGAAKKEAIGQVGNAVNGTGSD